MASEAFDQKEKISLHVKDESSDVASSLEEESSDADHSSPVTADVPENSRDSNAEGSSSVNDSSSANAVDTPDFAGRFEVLELIGEGGMGVVYKVQDTTLNKQFAVKILRKTLANDKQALKRFQREAEAATKLNHPGLVAVYEQGTLEDGTPFMVMDFVEGQNLADVIAAGGSIEAARSLRIFDHVLEALEHVHQSGLIHRDVKPRNIIISKSDDGDDKIKLVDFGIAREATLDGATTGGVTQTGDFLGRPLYMSPEQCQGAELESRSDIYSAGCVLYEMLTAKTPFASPNPVKIVVGHLSEKPAPPSSAVAEKHHLLSDLDFIVLKCLEKSPDKRYQSVKDIREDLAACLDNRSPHRDRQASKRKQSTILAAIAGVILLLIVLTLTTGAPLELSWYLTDNLKPHAPLMFGVSLSLFLLFSSLISRARSKAPSKVSKLLSIPWAVSYIVLLPSYLMLPHVPLETNFLIPYIALTACSVLSSIVFCLKYVAFPKQQFFAPKLESSGRVLTQQERNQLSAWRKAAVSVFAAGALLFKAPEFLPLMQFTPIVGSLLMMWIFIFLSHKVQKRLSRPEWTRPGDRWLMFAGTSAAVACLGQFLNGLINYLADSFMVTVAFSSGMGVVTAIGTVAPLLIAIVFLCVWSARRHSISPFGKSDGW